MLSRVFARAASRQVRQSFGLRAPVRFLATPPPSTINTQNSRVFGSTGKSAGALFDAAKSDGTVAKVGDELHKFAKAFDEDEELMMRLLSPLVQGDQFKPYVNELFPQYKITTPAARELIEELVTTRGVHKLKRILDDFDRLAQWDKSEAVATVTSAQELTKDQLNRLTAALQKHVGSGEKLVLMQKVQPDLLGGLKVELGDRAIDLTVASRLAEVDREIRSQ